MGATEDPVPGGAAAHGEAGEIEAVGVGAVAGDDVVEEDFEVVDVPPLVRGALGGDEDEVEVLAGLDELGRAPGGDFPNVSAALAGAVEEEDQGIALVGMGSVVFGEVDEVVVGDAVGDGFVEGCRNELAGRG